MAVVVVLSSQQWQLFFSRMADMLAARQHAREFIMEIVSVLFVTAAVLQPDGRYVCCSSERKRVHHGNCGSSTRNGSCSSAACQIYLLPVSLQQESSSWQLWLFSPRSNMAAVLQQHSRYACCSSDCCRRYNLWLAMHNTAACQILFMTAILFSE